ncbi:MAG: hypothetical protein ACE5J7_01380 [Candidatus Aenigmatarchaeota archaeon]
MTDIALLALGVGSIAALATFFLYIRREKKKLKKSVLRYEKIKKKMENNSKE